MRNNLLLTTVPLCPFCVNTQNKTIEYIEKVRNNASTFHKNFSSGDFEKNGPLVNDKIYVNSNNAIVIGRNNFIARIKRFHTPFPTLKLKDKIIIVDHNQVALLYIMQGTQDGPYGTIPASGNKINVYAAEFFTMDDDAKMKELLTITQLDQLMNQITGQDKVEMYENISLLPIKSTNADIKKKLNNTIERYVQDFNTRDWQSLKEVFAPDTTISINGRDLKDADELIVELKDLITTVPDITYLLTRNVVEGDRGAIAYEVHGTYNPSHEQSINGFQKSKKLEDIKQAAHFQLTLDGKISNAVFIFNSNDFKMHLQ